MQCQDALRAHFSVRLASLDGGNVARRAVLGNCNVVFDGDRKKFSVLELDGTLNENPGFEIRSP